MSVFIKWDYKLWLILTPFHFSDILLYAPRQKSKIVCFRFVLKNTKPLKFKQVKVNS